VRISGRTASARCSAGAEWERYGAPRTPLSDECFVVNRNVGDYETAPLILIVNALARKNKKRRPIFGTKHLNLGGMS